jgi:gamma-glutamylcyclotransferase (GGCT)/AIG2-like uncharacterized protein YtfP
MKKQNKLYIAYGSNLHLEQMALRCPKAKVVGTAVLNGYVLEFKGSRQFAVATITPCEGSSVPVLVWEITPKDERSLDFYEGFPNLYYKENLRVDLDGKPTETMVYIMTAGNRHGKPSARYYQTIREGYKSAGFDVSGLDAAVFRSHQKAEKNPATKNASRHAEQAADDAAETANHSGV